MYGKPPPKPIAIIEEDSLVIANEIMLVGLRLLKEITARDLVSSFEEIEIWLSTLLKPSKAQETSFLDDLLLQNILTKSEGALLIPCRLLLLVGLQYSSKFIAEKIVGGSLRLAHSIETFLIYFFKIRDWVTHEIIECASPKERTVKLIHFIHTAMVLSLAPFV